MPKYETNKSMSIVHVCDSLKNHVLLYLAFFREEYSKESCQTSSSPQPTGRVSRERKFFSCYGKSLIPPSLWFSGVGELSQALQYNRSLQKVGFPAADVLGGGKTALERIEPLWKQLEDRLLRNASADIFSPRYENKSSHLFCKDFQNIRRPIRFKQSLGRREKPPSWTLDLQMVLHMYH